MAFALHAGAASAILAAKPEVRITKDSAVAWDPTIHARVVADMADGEASSALQPPQRIAFRIPKYPTSAARAAVQGLVVVEARVGVTGKIEEFTLEKGETELVKAVKAAMSKWRYKPLKLDGTAYDIKVSVEVAFNLR
jgi:TonB family protein